MAESSCASEGMVEVLIEPQLPQPLLAVVGDSPGRRRSAISPPRSAGPSRTTSPRARRPSSSPRWAAATQRRSTPPSRLLRGTSGSSPARSGPASSSRPSASAASTRRRSRASAARPASTSGRSPSRRSPSRSWPSSSRGAMRVAQVRRARGRGGRPGVRDDGRRHRRHTDGRARGDDVLVLLPRLLDQRLLWRPLKRRNRCTRPASTTLRRRVSRRRSPSSIPMGTMPRWWPAGRA